MIDVLDGLASVERDLIRTRTAERRSRATARAQHMSRPSKLTEAQKAEARSSTRARRIVAESAHGSASNRNYPPVSTICLRMANRSMVERANRSMRVTVTTSPGAEVRALNAVLKEAGPGLSGTVFGLSKAEAVCMGGIVRNEVIVKFDLRKTHPGGDDLGKDWAKRTVSSGPRAVAAD